MTLNELVKLTTLWTTGPWSLGVSSLVKIRCYLLKLASVNENMGVSRADNSVNIWRNLPISNPKPDLLNVNAYSKFGENPLLFTSYSPETKIWACLGQITPSKIHEICPLAIANQISTISMHIPSLVKILSCVLKLWSYSPETKIWQLLGQITLSKIDEICPLAIANQISKISMHIPSLVKIHWCLLKLSSGNEKRTDGQTDGLTDDQRETIIPRHYCEAGYKNWLTNPG